MLTRIRAHLLETLDDSVRWFYEQMPPYYFKVSDLAEQARHLETIHALRRTADARLTMIDDGQAGKLLVFGRPQAHGLLDVVAMIGERPFHRVELHTSRDHSLFLYAFVYGQGQVPPEVDLAAHRRAIAAACCPSDRDCILPEVVQRYLDAVDQGYLARSAVERVERHVRVWARLAGGEDAIVDHEELGDGSGMSRFLVAATCLKPWRFLRHLARIIERYRLRLVRGYLDWVPPVDGGERALIASLYVMTATGKPVPAARCALVVADLAGVQRLFEDDLVRLYQEGSYSLGELELLRAGLGFAGQRLGPDYPYLDLDEIGEAVLRAEPVICHGLCDLLAGRFAPGRQVLAARWQRQRAVLARRITAVEPALHHSVLEQLLAFVVAVRSTNAWRRQRSGLACMLDPEVLVGDERFAQRPYGVIAFSAPAARGFHIRFRASARGGLRLVVPRGPAAYQRARDGLLKEVYDLAWAQQLKNKDIPEGGSKCIALVEPGYDPDAAVRAVVDPLLDLILPGDLVPEVLGAHGAERTGDLIFLGPDENMTPPRILWVAERAARRGLPHHLTLMSSKPGSGINHKEYGVTSEGIFRWIALVLPHLGLAGDAPYTVKLTGGPDGDVGGNLLRVLHREHAARCQVVAIADGTGYAVDPAGLDWNELLRLVAQGVGIAQFAPARLSGPAARVVVVTDKVGEQARNALHNTVEADLFLPCGGRPYAINDGNWQAFLKADGRPSARAMVEGANIFLTPEARRRLEDAGLMVIKDSSANKGGVICSSYEVLAGLVLSEAEFVAVKADYVRQVIAILCGLADSEGRALIAAWKRRGQNARLSELSQQISEEINRVSGLVEVVIDAHLDEPAFAPTWARHLEAHCPAVLVERFRERLHSRIPRAHRVAILSKRLASQMVYREGLTWCRTYLTGDRLWEVLSTYLLAESEVRTVIEALRASALPNREDLVRVIAAGSQRELVRQRLGQEF